MESDTIDDPEASIAASSIVPGWAAALVALGEQFASLCDGQHSHRLTVALCLPCIDYAAAFIGVGILKARLGTSSLESHKTRLQSLAGMWVSFENKRKNTLVGILEFCQNSERYKIKLNRNHAWLLDEEDFRRVRPTGLSFIPERRLSDQQIESVKNQYLAISALGHLFQCDLWKVLDSSGLIFRIHGNQSRLSMELSTSLFDDRDVTLEKVLRPKGLSAFADSFHCALRTHSAPFPVEDKSLVVIEAGRCLSDQLAASRHLNRVVLLARNAAHYEDCAGQIMEAFSLRRPEDPEPNFKLPNSIRVRTFNHT